MEEITMIKQCSCGAYTIFFIDENGDEINNSMSKETFKKIKKELNITVKVEKEKYCNCNHCGNRWGIDLCGCGSGEKVGKCDGDFHECRNKIPAQELGVRKAYALWG